MRIFIFLIVTFFIGISIAGLRFNFTNSVDFTVYLLDEEATPKRGDYVSICHADNEFLTIAKEREYLEFSVRCKGSIQPLVKPIVALAGDVVEVDEVVRVNGIDLPNSKPKKSDAKGLPLPVAKKREVVAESDVWLLSSFNENSWDSRYYGSIPKTNILGVVKPLF